MICVHVLIVAMVAVALDWGWVGRGQAIMATGTPVV